MSLIFLLLGCATEDDSSIQLVEASINDLQLALLNGDVSCREIVEGYIARIEAYDQSRGINAITEINPNALVRADTIATSQSQRGANPKQSEVR